MPKDGGSGRTTGGGPLKQDDAVILHGLTKAEMNGKKGTIVPIEVAASKGTIVPIEVAASKGTIKVLDLEGQV